MYLHILPSLSLAIALLSQKWLVVGGKLRTCLDFEVMQPQVYYSQVLEL